MARPSLYDPGARGNDYLSPNSDRKRVRGSDLDNVTLQSGEWITVWSTEVKADTALFWGFGPRNRQAADATFAYLELLANGSGTGTDGDVISGDVRYAVQDSTGDDIRRREWNDLDDLADAQAQDRTERIMQPELQPGASEDKHLALQVKVEPSQDGVVVGNDSNSKVHYGQYSGV